MSGMSIRKVNIMKKMNDMLKLYRDFTDRVYAPFANRHRQGVLLCNIALSVYVATIVILIGFVLIDMDFVTTLFSWILLSIVLYQGFKAFLLKHGDLCVSRNEERSKFSWKLCLLVSLITFAIFLLNLLANYPGGISSDNVLQWQQIQSGNFNNWHPAIHTMMIWLVTRIVPSYSFFVGFQILIFSLMTGYMSATLAAWGIKKGWIFLVLVVIISPSATGGIILFALKDTALTILFLCLAVYMINIVFSDGKWLSKWYNAGALASIGALALVRHNGFFFTLTLGVLIIIFYRKVTRNAIFTVIASICMMLGVTKVLYPLANVAHPPSQIYVESVGLPMTILSGVMANNPQALDHQTFEFMSKFGTSEEFREFFTQGNFNSVKSSRGFSLGTGLGIGSRFNEVAPPPREFIRMTLRTIKSDLRESLIQVIALTSIVWDPLDRRNNVSLFISPRALGVMYTKQEIEAMQSSSKGISVLNHYLQSALQFLFPDRIASSIGVHMLLILAAGIYSVNRNLKAKALVLFLPSIAYNLGTMLLLAGADYRFFHFNVVITIPLVIALLAKKEKPTPEAIIPR